MVILIMLRTFDPKKYLETKADFFPALKAAFQEDPGDGSLIASTLSDIVKAYGITTMAKDTRLSEKHLAQALTDQNTLDLATLLKVTEALGFELHVVPSQDTSTSASA